MKLTVLGATGRTGRLVVRQAIDLGHDVTAVVRNPDRLGDRDPRLRVATSDVTDPDALAEVLGGQEAVISALGARNNKEAGIATAATRALLRALPRTGCRRLVAVSAVPVDPDSSKEPVFMRSVVTPLLRTALRAVYDDLTEMERQLTTEPDLDWTIVRPPRLLDQPGSGRYRTRIGGNVPGGRTLARADLAHALLAMAPDRATVQRVVGVAY